MTLLDRFQLTGKIAIVTGASSGIGRAVAAGFAEAGATVYGVARREDRLSALARQQPGVRPWAADLADLEVCERLVAGVLEDANRIDVLVNNAGISNISRAEEEGTMDFRQVVDLNLMCAFILSREAGKSMIRQGDGGSIINVGSTAGVIGSGDLPQVSYAASKAGCINMARELAVQWARHRIRVNALAPGWVDTEMTTEYLKTDRGKASVQRLTPLRRPATADEVACAALFLASDASSYITGAVLPVDGGWTAA
jgi:NAD(P)-dependent dehydrogenase (short-subunit alcohol dehydrogenase family)